MVSMAVLIRTVPSVPGYLREEKEHKPDPWRNPIERNHMGLHLEKKVARRVASDHHRSHAPSITAVNAGLKILWRGGGNGVELIFKPAFTAVMARAWDRWWSDATRLATSFSRCNPMWFLSMGVTSRISFMFLLFPQVSRNWRYESEPPLKPSLLTCYKVFETNSIIVLTFVESQRVHT